MAFTNRVHRIRKTKLLGIPPLLLSGCVSFLRWNLRHVGPSLLRIGRMPWSSGKYAPLALIAISALLLGPGVAAWTQAPSIAEMTFVARSLAAVGQPEHLASVLRTLGIVSSIAGGLLALVLVRGDSVPFQKAKGVTWSLVAVAGLAFAASVGVFTQAEGLSAVSIIWDGLGIDITASDARVLLIGVGIAGAISGSTVLLILFTRQHKPGPEQELPYEDRRGLGRAVFRLALVGVSVVVLLFVGLLCFHWLRGATLEGSVGMMIEDTKTLVSGLSDPKSISAFFERPQGESGQALK